MKYTFWDESTVIPFTATTPDACKYVYETSVPVELYVRANIEPKVPVVIGKVFPVVVGVKVIVFIVTADDEVY